MRVMNLKKHGEHVWRRDRNRDSFLLLLLCDCDTFSSFSNRRNLPQTSLILLHKPSKTAISAISDRSGPKAEVFRQREKIGRRKIRAFGSAEGVKGRRSCNRRHYRYNSIFSSIRLWVRRKWFLLFTVVFLFSHYPLEANMSKDINTL